MTKHSTIQSTVQSNEQSTVQSTVAMKPQSSATLGTMHTFLIPQENVNVGVIERLASLMVGATVVLIMARRFLLSSSLILVGIYLFYRGATGYCPLYATEQIDTRHWRMKWPLRREFWGNSIQSLRKAMAYRISSVNWNRSKNHEQDNSTRQMATRAWQPENGMGPTDGQ